MGRGGRLPAPPLLRLPSPLRGIAASISAVLRHQEYEGYVLTQNTSTAGKASPKPAAKRTARAGAKSATKPTAAKRGSAPEVDANAKRIRRNRPPRFASSKSTPTAAYMTPHRPPTSRCRMSVPWSCRAILLSCEMPKGQRI